MLNGRAEANQKYFLNGGDLIGNASTSAAYNQQQQQQQSQQQQQYQAQMLQQRMTALQQSTSNYHQKLIPETLREYLRNKENCDCILDIYHAKVAQKSYGAEKRFFCPPPMVFLRGKGWKIRAMIAQNAGINAEAVLQQFVRFNEPSNDYDYEEPVSLIGIAGSKDQEKHMLEWQKDPEGRCAIKALHISENDNNRRKYFTLSVQCFYKSGQLLGQYESTRIKVISKPSKKKNITSNKQTDIKNQGINIASGTQIALFSRVRSQTTNTRYLFVKDGKFVAHSKFWGSFTIHLIDIRDDEPLDPYADDFHVRDGFINYGSIVKLVDSVSGLALPMMKICKVDKQDLVSERDSANEQVSQLHRCAFQMQNNDKLFMCFTNDQIVQQDALSMEKDGRCVFKDGAQWTIISTDTTHYRFYEALGPVSTQISPVPIVNSLDIHASDTTPTTAYVELQGQNFYDNLQVWIGSTPVQTFIVNKELIRFALPPLSALSREEGVDFTIDIRPSPFSNQSAALSPGVNQMSINGVGQEHDIVMEFPVLLARNDGVIYATESYVSYTRPKDGNNIDGSGIPRAQPANL